MQCGICITNIKCHMTADSAQPRNLPRERAGSGSMTKKDRVCLYITFATTVPTCTCTCTCIMFAINDYDNVLGCIHSKCNLASFSRLIACIYIHVYTYTIQHAYLLRKITNFAKCTVHIIIIYIIYVHVYIYIYIYT